MCVCVCVWGGEGCEVCVVVLVGLRLMGRV